MQVQARACRTPLFHPWWWHHCHQLALRAAVHPPPLSGDALEWACVLNLALMCVHWAPEVLASPAAAEVHSPTTGELLHRGIRPRIGIYRVSTGCRCMSVDLVVAQQRMQQPLRHKHSNNAHPLASRGR